MAVTLRLSPRTWGKRRNWQGSHLKDGCCSALLSFSLLNPSYEYQSRLNASLQKGLAAN